MIIRESNKEKIEEFITKAEGKARVRTIDFKTIVKDIKCLERELDIPKMHMVGIKAFIDHHAENFPNAYKGRPMSTQYMIERKSSGWDLRSVERDDVKRESKAFTVVLTDDAKEAIIKTKTSFGF